jgi:hypothetical protein
MIAAVYGVQVGLCLETEVGYGQLDDLAIPAFSFFLPPTMDKFSWNRRLWFLECLGRRTGIFSTDSPPASLHSLDSGQDSHAPVEVSAFTIDRRIVRKEIWREMNKILKAELKAALNASTSLGNIPISSWIVERVQHMTATWYPSVKAPSSSPSKKKTGSEKETSSIDYFVNPAAAERLQPEDFYSCLAQDMMRVGRTPFSSKQREKDESDGEDEQERGKREHETRVRDVMEVVERTITSLFYDRFVLFCCCPSFSELLIFQ